MSAESIGGQLTALSKMLKSLMKDASEPAQKWDVLLLNIETQETGAVQFDFAICPKVAKAKSDAPATQPEAQRLEL